MGFDRKSEIPDHLFAALLELNERQLTDVHKFVGERLDIMRSSIGHGAVFPDEKTDLVFLIGHLLGITSTFRVSVVSRLHYRLVCSVSSALRSFLPPKIYVCGGFNRQGESLNVVESFCPSQGSWEAQEPMHESRGGCAVVGVGQRLYILGGVSNGRALRSVEVFLPLRSAWESLPPMRLARWDSAGVALDGNIYLCGGCSGFSDCVDMLDAVDCLDIAQNLWTILPPLPSPRTGCVATSAKGVVYVQGGRQTCRLNRNLTTNIFGDLLRFLPIRGQWEHLNGFLSAVLPKHFGSMVASTDQYMFVLGGEDWTSRSANVFRINLFGLHTQECPWESWEMMKPLDAPRIRGAAVSVDGLIYIFGGEAQAGHNMSKVEVYNPSEEHRPGIVSEMPSMRYSCAAAVLHT